MKICPECRHQFQGNGWDGIDAHWKAKHETIMPYKEAWPHVEAGTYHAHKGEKLDAWLEQYCREVEARQAAHPEEADY